MVRVCTSTATTSDHERPEAQEVRGRAVRRAPVEARRCVDVLERGSARDAGQQADRRGEQVQRPPTAATAPPTGSARP